MNQTYYLSIKEILELHQRTIDKHGGKSGVRDLGLLESAIFRCQSGYYETLCEQAATLLQGLCMNHCFIDGNKRVALLATAVFLKMNGCHFICSNKMMVDFILNKVISKKYEIKDIAKWLSQNIECI